jgi:hypothetical protein
MGWWQRRQQLACIISKINQEKNNEETIQDCFRAVAI